MGVDHNHYNYQIAVIFAILIGGCLLLGLTVAAIYYVCVVNMREDKKKLTPVSTRQSPSPFIGSQTTAYRAAEPAPSYSQQQQIRYDMPPPPQQQYQTQQYFPQQTPQFDVTYNRSTFPSPSVTVPQPLLAPQSYDPYRQGFDDVRTVSVPPPQSQGYNYHQSSV